MWRLWVKVRSQNVNQWTHNLSSLQGAVLCSVRMNCESRMYRMQTMDCGFRMKTRPTCVHYGGAGLWLTRPKQLSSNRSRRHNLLPSVAFNLRAAHNQPASCLNKAHFHQHNQICIIAKDIIIQWCHRPPPSTFQSNKLCTIVNNQISKSKVTKLSPFLYTLVL